MPPSSSKDANTSPQHPIDRSTTPPSNISTANTGAPAPSEPIQIQVDPSSSHTLVSPRAGSRRPPPSPANSPGNLGPSAFTQLAVHNAASAYKRARTVSPIIDEYSSDVEQENRSPRSQVNSDVESDAPGQGQQHQPQHPSSAFLAQLPQSHQHQSNPTPAAPLQPTPLRESHILAPAPSILAPGSTMVAPKSDAADKTIEGLMTEKSLRLDDSVAAARSQDAASAAQADELPSYAESMVDGEAIDATTPSAATRPPGAEQLRLIKPMKTQPMVAGENWYLIDRNWYKLWSTACAQDGVAGDDDAKVSVGPIDNRALLEEDSTVEQAFLRTQINEGIDFEMLPEQGWTLLASWYGVDGPVFARTVVEGVSGQESVEFYPPRVRLLKMVEGMESGSSSSAPGFSISASQPLSQLKERARQALGLGDLADRDVRFWHVPEPVTAELERGTIASSRIRDEGVELIDANEDNVMLYRPEIALNEVGIDEIELTLAIETKVDGRWLSSPPAANKSIFAQTGGDFFSNLQQPKSAAHPQLSTAYGAPARASSPLATEGRITRTATARERASGGMRGLRGLNNLGNTCFMNSALQCLSNTHELQQYFFSGVYKEELNTDNPLGMGGAIAEAFGNLIKQLWDGAGGSFWPREFKHALARFAPQFSGYAQHDSQELLAFLLDGLHEDLNRIIKKPYIEAPDWMGGGEKEMVAFAKKQWDIYKARNDSVIVDLFQGQYKSTLVCPECEKVSIKFDPFMYLTLPIPNKKKWRCTVFFVPYDWAKQISSFEVQLPAGSNVGQLRQKVATHFGVDTRKLVAGEVWSHRMFKWMQDYEPVIDIKQQDYIYFWELPVELRSPKRSFKGYRYHSTLADAEEGLVIPEEEAAVVPVFTSVESPAGSSHSRAFMSRRNDTSAVGLPFFVAVPKDSVNDPEAIERAVMQQYKRFAPNPSALDEALAPSSEARSSANGNNNDWEIVNGAGQDDEVSDTVVDVAVPVQLAESTGVVTEIREDGVAVEVPDVPQDDAPVVVDRPNESSLPQKPTVSAAPKPIRALKFTTVTEAGMPFPKGGNNDSTENMAEDLNERLARIRHDSATAAAVDSDAAAVNATVTIPDEDEPEPLLSPPSTPDLDIPKRKDAVGPTDGEAKSLPLIYTSGAIVCVWNAAAFEKLLVTPESGHHWGKYAEAVDDEIAKEAASNAAAGANAKPKALSIEDCMDEFTREEKLGQDDPWYCPSCKDFRQATKKFDLWKAPDILVVHLKRFSAGRHSRDKLNVNIDFPLEGLDLSERVEGAKAARRVQAEAAESGEELGESMYGSGILQPEADNDDAVAIDAPIYDLYGVDNHFGGLGGGHYTAYAKNPEDGKWYEFDDSSVRPVPNPETVKSSSAYLLFYRRRTTRPIGGKSRQKFQRAVSERAREAASKASSLSSASSPDNGSPQLDAAAPADGGFDDGDALWPGVGRPPLASPGLDEPHPPGWLAGPLAPPVDDDDDDFDMFKPSTPSPQGASSSSDDGAEPGSPRSTLSSVGSRD